MTAGNDGSVFGGSESVILRSHATVHCGKEPRAREFWVAIEGPADARQQVVLPVPSSGYGGSELVVSPDQRWAALFIYSGQSEAGYELFALEPALAHVGQLPYVRGEGTVPVFSPDSQWLVMVTTNQRRVRGTGEYAEEVLGEGEGEVLIDWATVHVQRVTDGPVVSTAIGTPVPRATSYDEVAEWTLDNATTFPSNDRIAIQLPWGERIEIALPLSGPITTAAPRE